MADLAELIDAARTWAGTDPDPHTRAELLAKIQAGDERWLSEGFGARLQFGTAGLRGALGPGPNRMNRALVRRVAAALGDYLLENVPGAASRGVVLGFDARRLSREFAADTAALLADRGIIAWLHEDYVPTPRLSHAVVQLGACAGVMVTASHNPPGDNGYKVYWGDGAQIVPPHDAGISAAIDALADFDPRIIGDLSAHRAAGLVREPDPSVAADYFARVQALRVHPTRPIRVVYTNMHGVGGESVRRALAEAGYHDIHDVAEQSAPDGDFPTVAFPNPEEPGALDLALALAGRVRADVIIANDPDGDRLAVAVPDGAGGFRPLTGNEVGALLGHDLLVNGDHEGRTPLLATTIVSSRMLSRIAAAHGAAYAETLTGFKWIATAAIAHDAAGGRFVLGFEEALGYSAGDVARDKDGVSAALLLVDLAADCKARGQTLVDHLADLFRAYGLHASVQRSVTLPGLEGKTRIAAAMERLRADPPTELQGVPVLRFVDVERGEQLELSSGARTPLELPRSDVLVWELADGSRVLARPSGTEPKIKFYAEVRDTLAAAEPLATAEARARSRLGPLVQSLLVRADLA